MIRQEQWCRDSASNGRSPTSPGSSQSRERRQRDTTCDTRLRRWRQVMTEASKGTSMFDYDARPFTPQVVLVGERASSVGYSIRDFLTRNGVPYEWVDLDDAE